MHKLSSAGIVGLLTVLGTVPLTAQTIAPSFGSVFGDNMVLPHGRVVTLSGSADPGIELTLEVAAADQAVGDGSRYAFAAGSDGQWRTEIASLPAGGPYRLSLRDGKDRQQILDNVLAGQIWLCSGQSNMAYSVAASVDQPEPYNHGTATIRLLSVPLRAELEARSEFVEVPAWQLATDDTVPRFSAVCYFAARRMIEQDGIPRGLVNASWGGSAIEAWISEDGLMAVDGYDHKVSQLRQFRRDRRAAELAFADDWVQWWQSSSNQGPVWEQGMLDQSADWREAPLVNWKTYPDERLSNHHGILWFSTSFRLSEAQSRQPATFVLGKIDEVDTTWINGRFVNNTFGYGTKREYPLQPGVLEAGINQITVNVLNTWDVGGMLGPADEVGLRFADGSFVPLGTGWRYRFIPRETGQPPRSPWESVSGVTGMFNGMIAPLARLQPDGVIWYQGESNAESSSTYRALLLALIDDWRRHFEKETLPFVIVQLPNYGSIASTPGRSGWATIRNAQQQVALADDRVGLVVTHDVGNDTDIHPRSKFVVGSRAAQVALALESGGGVEDGVAVTVASARGGRLALQFMPPLRLTDSGQPIDGFILCDGEASRCVATTASQAGSRVDVSLAPMPDATLVRYCWSDGGLCALEATNGLPVSSFEVLRDN